jgi:hypothetical protein
MINNVVEGYGRVFPGSTGIEQGDASNNLYTHNEIYDGYKGAIHICFCNDTSYPQARTTTSSPSIWLTICFRAS